MSSSSFVSVEAVTSHPALQQLADELQQRFRERIVAILVYGSCLRSGDPMDGLVDLYLLCDDYRETLGGSLPALANRLLPPNVYYAQSTYRGETMRAKVALLSLGQFRRACSMRCFESYIWGRFAQPVALLAVRDAATRKRVDTALKDAQFTLLRRALPLMRDTGSVSELWSRALTLSYSTELRTERPGRAEQLVAWQPDFYRQAVLAALRRDLPGLESDGEHYRYTGSGPDAAPRGSPGACAAYRENFCRCCGC